MGIEVASLTASFDFKVKGEEAVKRSFEQIRRAQEALQNIGDATSANVAAQQLQITKLSKELQQATESYQQTSEAISKTGITVENVTQKFQNANTAMAAAETKLDGLRAQLSRLNRQYRNEQKDLVMLKAARVQDTAAIAKQQKKLDDLKQKIAEVTAEQKKWEQASQSAMETFQESIKEAATIGEQRSSYEEMVKTASKLESAVDKLNSTTASGAKNTQLGRYELGRWISMARSGSLSNELLAEGFARIQNRTIAAATGTSKLAGTLKGLGASGVIAAVVAVVAAVTALYKAIMKTVQVADEINELSGFFGPLDDSMKQLAEDANITESALGSLLGTARNQGQAVGIRNATAYAEQIAKIADQLRYLGANTRDFSKAFQVIEAATKGSLGALENYGIRTDRITQSLEDLGPAASEAARRATILAGIQQELAAKSDMVSKRMANEKTTMADVKAEFAKMWETVAQELAPALSDLLATIKPLIKNFTYLLKVLVNIVTWVVKAGTFLYKFLLAPMGILAKEAAKLADILGANGLAAALDDMGNNILDAAFGVKKAATELDDFNANIDDSVGAAQRAKAAFAEMRGSLTGGFSAVGAAKDLAVALDNINKKGGNTAANLLQVGESFNRIVNAAADNDLNAQLETLDSFMGRLADRGEITADQFNQWRDMLDATKDVLQPVIDLTDDMKGAAAQTEAPMNHAANSISNAGSSAEVAAGQVRNLTQALEQMTGTYEANVVVNMAGVGGVTVGGTGAANTVGGIGGAIHSFVKGATETVVRALGLDTSSSAKAVAHTRNTPSETTRGIFRQPASAVRETDEHSTQKAIRNIRRTSTPETVTSDQTARSAAGRLAGMFASSGGGGGGGGAKLATADDIRKFIAEVNRAIVAGIRGGKVFSTAGNAIPLTEGGFISSQGGSLVENVTIKGVWDFADPAAKREIVRQLREALADLSKEVA